MSDNYDMDLTEFNRIKNKFLNYYKNVSDDFISKLVYSINCFNELFANNTILKDDCIYISFNGGKDCLAVYLILKYFYFCKAYDLDHTLISSFNSFSEKQKNFKSCKSC